MEVISAFYVVKTLDVKIFHGGILGLLYQFI